MRLPTRPWKVIALVEIPGIPGSQRWEIAARRWTERGAARTASRWSRTGRQQGPFVRVLAYGYQHANEDARWWSEGLATR